MKTTALMGIYRLIQGCFNNEMIIEEKESERLFAFYNHYFDRNIESEISSTIFKFPGIGKRFYWQYLVQQ